MRSVIRSFLHELRASLFVVPTLYVVGSVGLAFATVAADAALTNRGIRLPALLDATVDSARVVLGTVAGATITFAAIAFSVALLMIQQAASNFSSRVLHGFFRDPFTKHVMGIALGTFGYSLFVLRAVRGPVEESGVAVIPYVSVFLGAALGVVAVVFIVAFIHHSAHSMEAAEVIRRITEDTKEQIRRLCPDLAGHGTRGQIIGPLPDGTKMTVRSAADGWVQSVDAEALLGALPKGGIARLDAGAGTFVSEGASLCTLWPEPDDPEAATAVARRAVRLGRTRTMYQDMALGVRQLVDIALRALSPGINDPTTAEESIVHLGSVLRELFIRDLPSRVVSDEHERRLFRPHDLDHGDYAALAFDQIRRIAATDPAVASTMLDTMGKLVAELEERHLTERAAILRSHARKVLAECTAENAAASGIERLADRWGFALPEEKPPAARKRAVSR